MCSGKARLAKKIEDIIVSKNGECKSTRYFSHAEILKFLSYPGTIHPANPVPFSLNGKAGKGVTDREAGYIVEADTKGFFDNLGHDGLGGVQNHKNPFHER